MTIIDFISKHNQSAIAISQFSQSVDTKKNIELTYAELIEYVNKLSDWLLEQKIKSVALMAQNSIDWIMVDLACQHAGAIITPVPLFFSVTQQKHLLNSIKATLLFSDQSLNLPTINYQQVGNRYAMSLNAYQLAQNELIASPKNTAKITFTSGSTGLPKGVCLSVMNQLTVAKSLVDVIKIEQPRHLCLLPLPTLLENIAGIYSPLIAGGTVIIANDVSRGFEGSRLVNMPQFLLCISSSQPDSLILVPELLQVLIQAIKNGWSAPKSLKFIAVGGSKVSGRLIEQARLYKLPIYQGYGLSECASVVSLSDKYSDPESVGKLLPHVDANAENGELIVKSNCFLGYLDQPESWYPKQINTGDLMHTHKGQLYISGRSKNLIINSFGRNISPEWLESELLASGLFQQAVIIGDNKPYCVAILTLMSGSHRKDYRVLTEQFISNLNTTLPDYAHIKKFILLTEPLQYECGLVTENGRLKRDEINTFFIKEINELYLESEII